MRHPRTDPYVLALAFAVLAFLFVTYSLGASRVIDGVRYFWLDDDMMISMRYGRNLAEGHGLVWNPGDRVEGYTNFLWTLVMAAAHLLPVADAHVALVVRAVNFVLLAGSCVLALRLLRVFAPRSPWAAPLLLLTIVMCPDVMLWSFWGFETTLLTFLSLLYYLRLLTRGRDRVAFVALALIPLTRGDGLYLFAVHALVGFALAAGIAEKKRALPWLAAALVPALVHLVFRRAYYGDWLPNTYYLKVYRVDAIPERGFNYARSFLLEHAILLTLAAGAALVILRTDRRGIVLLLTVPATLVYVVLTGGDMFGWFRFFAHVMPIILVFATAGFVRVVQRPLARAVWAVVLYMVSVPLMDPLKRLMLPDTNGDPEKQLRVALAIQNNALPDSTVAVFCAGMVPYFTHLRAIDLLGKSDRHIARLPAFPGAMVGHGKVDPEYSFALNPDLVVTCNTGYAAATNTVPGTRAVDPMVTLIAAPSFRSRYLPYPIDDRFLLEKTAVYTYLESKEYPRRHWLRPALPLTTP